MTSISSTPETPQNRYLFLSSGKAVHRLDLATNSITASQSISAVSGLAISPSQPSKARVTRFYPIGLNQTIGVKDPTLPLVIRALDDTGLPVLGALVSFEASLDINPHVRQQTIWTTTNSDGYAQRRFVLQYTGPDDWTGYANVRENDGLLERFVIKRSLWTDELVVPNKLSIQRGNGQIVYSSKEAPSTLEVLVTGTRYSEVGVANVPVKWAIVGGRGQLKWQQTITDSRGIATNTFTGPVLAGLAELLTSTIQATAAFTSPARFSMTTIPQVSASGNQIGAVLGLQRLFPRDQSVISATSGSMIAGGLRYKLAAGRGIGLDVRVAGESVCQPSMPDRLSRLMKPPATDDDGIVGCDLVARKAIGRGIAQVYIGGQHLEDLPIHVVAGPPRRITIVSSSTGYGYWRIAQSPGRPAVAIVDDGWGNALNDVPVRWDVFGRAVLSKTVLKSAAASYSNIEHPSISHTSDGVVSTDVSLASPADYTEIGVAVVSNLSVNAVALLVEPASITKLDGDGQSTPAAANFTRPLVVEVPTEYYFGRFFAAGLVINFRATGGLVLSSAVAFTDAQGRAEVSVVAGSTVGTHMVTATAGILTTTFQLTVAAPAITSIVNGASFAPGLSPCAMAQLTGRNFAAGTYIAIGGHPAPLYSSSATSITFQVPCELPPGPTPLQLTSASESVIQQVTIAPYAPGVFENAAKQAVALKADGTYVSATNPAELGEEIRLFATGLGQTSPVLTTNTPGSGERVNAKVLIGLGNEGIEADAVYAPALTGTYIVTFRIPRSIMGGVNRPIGVAIQTSEGSFIHSQPSRIDIR